MNMRIDATYDLTLRSSANASQSLCHASFRAESETNRLVARVSALTGNGANPADGECEWVISEDFEDDPASLAQMPALRPPFCDARSSGSASLGDAREAEESCLTDKRDSGQEHDRPPEASLWRSIGRSVRRLSGGLP